MQTKWFSTIVLAFAAATAMAYPDYGSEFTVGDLKYKVVSSGSQWVQVSVAAASTNISGVVTIPGSVDFQGIDCAVTSVEDNGFANCDGIIEVVIGGGVTNIGYCAFRSCHALRSIYIGSGMRVINLGFQDCPGVNNVFCYANLDDLSWISNGNDFRQTGTTMCHVFGDAKAWTTKFPDIKLTFVGDLGNLPATYELWAAINNVSGSWNDIDALGVHNVFRYAFDKPAGAFDDPPLIGISFDADGRPVVVTPPLNPIACGFDFDLVALDSLAESGATGNTNLIFHSTFDTDISGWDIYRETGGRCTLHGENGKLALKVSRVGLSNYSVQIFHDGVPLHRNGRYRLQYDISSTTDRYVEAMIQKVGGTYQAYTWRGLDITAELQTVDYEFTMEQDTDTMAKLVFNCGLQEKDPDLPEHTIYLDNVSLELLNPEDCGLVGTSWPLSPTGTNVITGDILPARFFRLRATEK